MTLTLGMEAAELMYEGSLNLELSVNDELNVIIEDKEDTNQERCDHEGEGLLPRGENDPGA